MLGIDNLMFSVDGPFQDNLEDVEFLHNAELSQEDKEKFAHGNAERLLKLAPARHVRYRSLSSSWHAFRAKSKSRIGRVLISFLVK